MRKYVALGFTITALACNNTNSSSARPAPQPSTSAESHAGVPELPDDELALAPNLVLNGKQRKALNEIAHASTATKKPLFEELEKRRGEMRALFAGRSPESSQVVAKQSEISAIKRQILLVDIDAEISARRDLTREQLSALTAATPPAVTRVMRANSAATRGKLRELWAVPEPNKEAIVSESDQLAAKWAAVRSATIQKWLTKGATEGNTERKCDGCHKGDCDFDCGEDDGDPVDPGGNPGADYPSCCNKWCGPNCPSSPAECAKQCSDCKKEGC